MLTKSICLAGIATLCAGSAISADLPHKVYRVDNTPPEVVFRDGFYSDGYDDNLIAHVNGALCDAVVPTSNFISTLTDTRSIARLIRAHQRERETTYVYTIRPESYFYNAANSVESFLNFQAPSSVLTLQSLQASREANEWVATSRIAPSAIEGVTEITRHGPSRYLRNSSYRDIPPDANPNIYHTYRPDTFRHNRFYEFSPIYGNASISACMATCFNDASAPFVGARLCRAPYIISTEVMLNAFF